MGAPSIDDVEADQVRLDEIPTGIDFVFGMEDKLLGRQVFESHLFRLGNRFVWLGSRGLFLSGGCWRTVGCHFSLVDWVEHDTGVGQCRSFVLLELHDQQPGKDADQRGQRAAGYQRDD